MRAFTENLNRLIEENEIVTGCMADDLEINRKTFYNYTSGDSEPKFDNLIKIADYLNVTVDELIR